MLHFIDIYLERTAIKKLRVENYYIKIFYDDIIIYKINQLMNWKK